MSKNVLKVEYRHRETQRHTLRHSERRETHTRRLHVAGIVCGRVRWLHAPPCHSRLLCATYAARVRACMRAHLQVGNTHAQSLSLTHTHAHTTRHDTTRHDTTRRPQTCARRADAEPPDCSQYHVQCHQCPLALLLRRLPRMTPPKSVAA